MVIKLPLLGSFRIGLCTVQNFTFLASFKVFFESKTVQSAHHAGFLSKRYTIVPRRLFFAAPQRIAITSSPKYYQKMQRSITRKNQEEHGPEVK